MNKIEGPQVMASILVLAVIGIVSLFVVPALAEKIVNPIITAIGMLGMKLLEKNGNSK